MPPVDQLALHLHLAGISEALEALWRGIVVGIMMMMMMMMMMTHLWRGIVVGSNHCSSIPKNDFQRVKWTGCHKTTTLLKRNLVIYCWLGFESLFEHLFHARVMRWYLRYLNDLVVLVH